MCVVIEGQVWSFMSNLQHNIKKSKTAAIILCCIVLLREQKVSTNLGLANRTHKCDIW